MSVPVPLLSSRVGPLGLWLALIFCLGASSVTAEPVRLVSLNLCLDQMLLRFAAPQRIASLTHFAANSQMSPLADRAKGIHLNHGLAEEIIPLAPDLILVGEYGAREAAQLLQTLNFRVKKIPLPRQLGDIETHLLAMAELLGASTEAYRYVAQWRELRQQLQLEQQTMPAPQPVALMLGPNNVVPGANTLEHEMLTLAGMRNWAAERGLESFASVDIEQIIADPPQLLIVDRVAERNFSRAHEVLRHPALQAAMRDGVVASLPANLSICPAPHINQLLLALVQLRQSLPSGDRL